MPKVQFQNVEETQEFSVIPEGKYIAEIKEVEETTSKNGDDMWKLKFQIIDGEYTNRTIFNYLVFNEKGYGNIKKLYKAIGGFDLAKTHNCQPVDIEGEKVQITVNISEYTKQDGTKAKNNSIAFAGYEAIDEEVPF